MGRVITAVGRVLAARLVLFKADVSDDAPINLAVYDGDIETIAPGIRAFRREDERLFVVQKIAAATVNATRYVLAVVYTPGTVRDAQAPFTALVTDLGVDVAKSWPVVLDVDGTLRVPALDADVTQIGTGVKTLAWPVDWRVRLVTDLEGALPTGARCLARVLA